MTRTIFVLVLFQALVAAAAGHVAAATYFETVDAGQLPELAQDVAVAGPVDAIFGRIENAFDADLFRLVIDDPATFSAAAVQPGTEAPDLQLFVFDAWGHGVAANDNWLFSPLPQILAGTLRGQTPGVFLLGVSPADDDPLGILGKIFPDVDSGISEPSGLSRFDRLLDWSRSFTASGGNYSIALTGAAGVLEPPLLPGDYNQNHIVDAADFTVWCDALGATGVGLAADGSGLIAGVPDGIVDQIDYEFWKSRFGMTAGSGALSGATVPEPGTMALLILAATGCLSSARPSHQSAEKS